MDQSAELKIDVRASSVNSADESSEHSLACNSSKLTSSIQQPSTSSSAGDSKSITLQISPHKSTPQYLQELLKDKRQIQALPGFFQHAERLLDEEISRVRAQLFSVAIKNRAEVSLPEPTGQLTTLQGKVYIPIQSNPTYNFVGRLLGPRGMTAKQLEKDLDCKIMIRGRGSMRDKQKEEQNRGKANWEHLTDELHVLIQVEDSENRVQMKLEHAVNEIKRFLDSAVNTPENEDELKKVQLMELAVLNNQQARDNAVNSFVSVSVGGGGSGSVGGSTSANTIGSLPLPLNAAAALPMPQFRKLSAANNSADTSSLLLATPNLSSLLPGMANGGLQLGNAQLNNAAATLRALGVNVGLPTAQMFGASRMASNGSSMQSLGSHSMSDAASSSNAQSAAALNSLSAQLAGGAAGDLSALMNLNANILGTSNINQLLAAAGGTSGANLFDYSQLLEQAGVVGGLMPSTKRNSTGRVKPY